jgi:hypothetical protein
MPFGKDPTLLSETASFRQLTGTLNAKTYKKKTRTGAPYYVDNYTPPAGAIDLVRLLKGNFVQTKLVPRNPPGPDPDNNPDDAWKPVTLKTPSIVFAEHFDGHSDRSCICSAGPWVNQRDRRQPCRGCDIRDATMVKKPNGFWESTRMSRQDKNVVCVFDYSKYHEVEQRDFKTGEIRLNQQTKEPYMHWVKCTGRLCEYCRGGKHKEKIGHSTHWPMSKQHFNTLMSTSDHIGKSCRNCGTADSIETLGWTCGGCGDCVVDMSTTELSDEQLREKTSLVYRCPHCNKFDFLVEVFECKTCADMGKQGAHVSIFDVDMKVTLIPNPNPEAKSKVLQVLGWSVPYPLAPKYAEEAGNVVDLVARYAPTPLSVQIERFGEVPVKREPQTDQSAPQNPQY